MAGCLRPARCCSSQLLLLSLMLLLLQAVVNEAAAAAKPNIVFVVADDLGWNDIGFNNPEIKSPHLDQLAREGVILNQTYVQPLCSPSRAALMTGVYPFRMGLQHLVILRSQPVCVPLNRTLLPEVLQNAGYATHMVGKWHLGFCDWRCTPTYRGFDTFYGFLNAYEDYYTKEYRGGFDFRDQETMVRSANGTYSTYLYTERIRKIIRDHDKARPLFLYLPYQSVHTPLQVPQKYLDLYPDIQDPDRKAFSGMVTAMDDAVGDVVASLKSRGIYNNTLLVFTADNGGWVNFGGNNYPLRGGKFTVFEGGTRAVSFVHGPMFNQTGVTYDGLMHMVDWFPTLVEAAGVTSHVPDQDGVSQWQSLLSLTTPSERQEVIYNLDLSWDPVQGRAAIRYGDYKLVAGFPGIYPDWYPLASSTGSHVTGDRLAANSSLEMIASLGAGVYGGNSQGLGGMGLNATAPEYYYLFNLKDDPEERENLYDSLPDVVKRLEGRLQAHFARYVQPDFPLASAQAEPDLYGGDWTPGWCPDIGQ